MSRSRYVTLSVAGIIGRITSASSSSVIRLGISNRAKMVYPIMTDLRITTEGKEWLARECEARDFVNCHEFKLPEERVEEAFDAFNSTLGIVSLSESCELLKKQFEMHAGSRWNRMIACSYRRSFQFAEDKDNARRCFAHVFAANLPNDMLDLLFRSSRVHRITDVYFAKGGRSDLKLSPLLEQAYEPRAD